MLGVDGGGTKTIVNISDLDGKVLAEAVSGSCNYKGTGFEESVKNINNGVLDAISEISDFNSSIFKRACFGIAGCDLEEDLLIYKKIVFNKKIKSYLIPDKTIICNDTRIGLEVGSNKKNKVIIISGTGSNCYGVNKYGQEAKASGWDYILGDEGSGYEIGIKALKALMKAYDKRGQKTLLSETIFEDLNIKNINQLIKWSYNDIYLKDRFASLAKTVCRTAEMGDSISIKILEEAAEELDITISAVVKSLDLVKENFDLVFVGNIFKCEVYLKNILINRLKDKFIKINFRPLSKKPVIGAIKLALRNL